MNKRFAILIAASAGLCTQAQFMPTDLPGLSLWLRGDEGVNVVFGGFVNQWTDQSGNNNHCTQGTVAFMPGVENSDMNGLQVVGFYGPAFANDFLDFTTEITDIRTVFWVLKENAAATNNFPRCLLGHHTASDFLRGPNKELWSASEASPSVLNGTTRVNMTVVDGTTTLLPSDYAIVSLRTTGPVSASSLTVDRLNQNHQWWGFMAEVIIYNQPLSDEEIIQVEQYLDQKYTPPFYADADVTVPYGFCPTTICAAPDQSNYLWSTGETTQCIAVQNTGDYAVQTVDRFSLVKTDTVHVQYDGNTAAQQALICLGDQYTWDLALDSQNYSIVWFDGGQQVQRTFTDEGIYQVSITDSNNCTLSTQLQLEVDNLSAVVSLGPDPDLCAGNTIGLLPHNFEITAFNWSTGEHTPSIAIQTSGTYSLEVTDVNGCTASDQIVVNILGVAPEISFQATGHCEDTPVAFHAVNLSSSTITQWQWSINGTILSGADVSYTFTDAGDYTVLLHAVAADGCFNDYSAEVHIYAAPVVNFSYSNACAQSPVEFTGTYSSAEGEVELLQWMINGNTYTGAQVTTNMGNAGFSPVVFAATTEYGCAGSKLIQVDVKAQPTASFEYANTCEGQLTTFHQMVDFSQSGPITQYIWTFGDNTGSFQPDPLHYYTQAGVYQVSLIAEAQSGCRDTLVQAVNIQQLPQVDFAVLNACLNQPYQLQPVVTTFNDPVIAWLWQVSGAGELTTNTPIVTFSSTGLKPVTLQVTTANGCVASVHQNIPVWPVPVASFTYSPEIGNAPFVVQFNNTSTGGSTYHWNFGNGQTSTQFAPQHTYEANGQYTVVLTTTNAYGCAHQASKQVLVDVPVADVQVLNLQCNAVGQANQISIMLVNAGNVSIKALELSWKIGNEAPVVEHWQGELLPGQSQLYTFQSLFTRDNAQFDYLCVSAIIQQSAFTETNLSNNQECKSLDDGQFELFPPFPNPGDQVMFVRFITPLQGDVELRIVDMSGRVWQQYADPGVTPGFHQYFMGIGSLADGSYILELRQGTRRAAQTFIKAAK